MAGCAGRSAVALADRNCPIWTDATFACRLRLGFTLLPRQRPAPVAFVGLYGAAASESCMNDSAGSGEARTFTDEIVKHVPDLEVAEIYRTARNNHVRKTSAHARRRSMTARWSNDPLRGPSFWS